MSKICVSFTNGTACVVNEVLIYSQDIQLSEGFPPPQCHHMFLQTFVVSLLVVAIV